MSWQDTIQQGLVRRDQQEKAFNVLINHYQRLSQQTAILKERNNSLLKAATSIGDGGLNTHTGGDLSVAKAYTASLESQLTSLRDELASVYKTQGQNAQRLLVMNEALREREERSRGEEEELRLLRVEVARLRERVTNHAEVMREKERNVQILQDELSTLQLEYSQQEQKIKDLETDNASLLQRWLDRLNDEAARMNDATQFLVEAEKKGLPPLEPPG
ncbi:autophagy-related protein 16 [Phakopsora pachyrhizi]|uniref:Autophagy-related protein 16 n=1 Tax=Phakopsora pachyrhizi TaxID=170000 RepID=A0AAV0AEF7_PHAPC|nr:autophagy-related protein 16 [Phakopsora pachyrhizi]